MTRTIHNAAPFLAVMFTMSQAVLHGSVFDDAKVYLRGAVDTDGDNVLDVGEYRDSFHYGTADASWSASAQGNCRLATERMVYSYRNVTNDETVVVLPQQVDVVDGNDVFHSGSVTLPAPFTPHLADGFSVALRMRWDGPMRWCIDDANSTMTNMPYCFFFRATGAGMSVALALNTPNRPPCDPSDSFAPLVQLFGNQKTFTNLYLVKTNEWIDAAFVVSANGSVTGYLHVPGSADIASQTVTPSIGTEAEGTPVFRLCGQTAGETSTRAHTSYGQRSEYMSFRGAFQRVAIWQRALTEDDVRSAFSEQGVDMATLGRDDGTADEFAGAAGSSVNVSAPAGSWQGFPSSFTAADAPAGVSFTLLEEAVPVGFTAMDQLLRMKTTPDSASGTWNLAVNGTALRPFSLDAGKWGRIRIPQGLLALGPNTLTLKYAGAGTAAIDCLLLGGNWRLGFQNDSVSEFSSTITSSQKTNFHVGNGRLSNVQKMILIQTSSNGQAGFHVRLPGDLMDGYRHFCVMRANKIVTDHTVPVSLYLNGASEPVGTHEVEKGVWRDYRYEIPLDALRKGDNAFVFKMTGADTESSTARYVGFDCFRFEAVPIRGMQLSFR